MAKKTQLALFKKAADRYGGDLLKTRKGRLTGRPLSTRHSMHFVLRSTKAKGDWSFLRHKMAIGRILERFGAKHGVQVLSVGNVGNHLHLHLKLPNRQAYKPFIRAVTAAIMMAVTGISRWSMQKLDGRFWDRRPFSRVVVGFTVELRLRDYILINKLEGLGYDRGEATFLMRLNTGKLNTS